MIGRTRASPWLERSVLTTREHWFPGPECRVAVVTADRIVRRTIHASGVRFFAAARSVVRSGRPPA